MFMPIIYRISPPDAKRQHFPSEPPSSRCFQLALSLSAAQQDSRAAEGRTHFISLQYVRFICKRIIFQALDTRGFFHSLPADNNGTEEQTLRLTLCLLSVYLHHHCLLYAFHVPGSYSDDQTFSFIFSG